MSIKDFKIKSKLGAGSYSEVFSVIRQQDQQEYAMKIVEMKQMNQSEKMNALNQVRILASLESPFVIQFKQAFLQDKCLYIIMEFASGGDLKQKIHKRKQKSQFFEEEEIWKFISQVVQGLKALHDCKVIHCDMKSANVFISPDGYKLADMNVSKVTKNGLIYTQTGTPYYASPQVWRDQPYDLRSDIWSLGVIIYEMAALKLPFQGSQAHQLFSNIQKGQYAPIPYQYSKELHQLVGKCINTDPFKRPNCDDIIRSCKLQKSEIKSDNQLLDTIKLGDFQILKSMLPKPKYQKKASPDNFILTKKEKRAPKQQKVRDLEKERQKQKQRSLQLEWQRARQKEKQKNLQRQKQATPSRVNKYDPKNYKLSNYPREDHKIFPSKYQPYTTPIETYTKLARVRSTVLNKSPSYYNYQRPSNQKKYPQTKYGNFQYQSYLRQRTDSFSREQHQEQVRKILGVEQIAPSRHSIIQPASNRFSNKYFRR